MKIVSRHPGAVAFIREQLPEAASAPVVTDAAAGDVRDEVVAGNLPLHLAALCRQVIAIEFDGIPPRGAEYTAEEMRQSGARLRRYVVHAVEVVVQEQTFNDGRRSRGHRELLFVGRGNAVHEFVGSSIAGVVAVVGRDSVQNGKWSHSTYQLRFGQGAWSLVSQQDWETGERFHGCRSVAAVIELFRLRGCTAAEAVITACLDQSVPKTMARIRQTEADVASVS